MKSDTLRQLLVETIRGVKEGRITPDAGAAVAKLANAVVKSAFFDLQAQREGEPPPTLLMPPIEEQLYDTLMAHGPARIADVANTLGADAQDVETAARRSAWFNVQDNDVVDVAK